MEAGTTDLLKCRILEPVGLGFGACDGKAIWAQVKARARKHIANMRSPMSLPPADPRLTLLVEWLAKRLAFASSSRWHPRSEDASFRRYFRVDAAGAACAGTATTRR